MKRARDEPQPSAVDGPALAEEGSARQRVLRGPDDYRNKSILAPMVRVGTLPMRLLALEYGSDIVYSEELIAHKLAKCVRTIDETSDRVEFVLPKGGPKKTIVFSTCPAERANVLQIGANEAVVALHAAELVCRDVDGIDVNMGCPKHFSTSGGMGAALLSKPDTARDIITTLTRNLPNPITAKVRMLGSTQTTVDFLRLLQQAGAAAVAVHARCVSERPKDPARWADLREVIDAANLDIPVIVNGDVFCFEDIQRAREATGASSVMIGRGAISDPSVFRPQPVVLYDAHRAYLRKCVECRNTFQNTKYTLLRMHTENSKLGLQHESGQALVHSKGNADLCRLWGLAEWYQEWERTEAPPTALCNKRCREDTQTEKEGNHPSQEGEQY